VPEYFGEHLARAARAHDSRSRVVQRKRDRRQIELRIRPRDVFHFWTLEWNAECLPDVLRPFREDFRRGTKDEITCFEEQA
jgi:hypothetical protein